jgi:hypothetical protein
MWISIDLNAFRMALAVGIIGLGYIASRRAPISFHEGYGRQAKSANPKGCAGLVVGAKSAHRPSAALVPWLFLRARKDLVARISQWTQ